MSGVDFESFLNGTAVPPIVPIVSGPGDTRHFEEYLEDLGEQNDQEENTFIGLGVNSHGNGSTGFVDPFHPLFREFGLNI